MSLTDSPPHATRESHRHIDYIRSDLSPTGWVRISTQVAKLEPNGPFVTYVDSIDPTTWRVTRDVAIEYPIYDGQSCQPWLADSWHHAVAKHVNACVLAEREGLTKEEYIKRELYGDKPIPDTRHARWLRGDVWGDQPSGGYSIAGRQSDAIMTSRRSTREASTQWLWGRLSDYTSAAGYDLAWQSRAADVFVVVRWRRFQWRWLAFWAIFGLGIGAIVYALYAIWPAPWIVVLQVDDRDQPIETVYYGPQPSVRIHRR